MLVLGASAFMLYESMRGDPADAAVMLLMMDLSNGAT